MLLQRGLPQFATHLRKVSGHLVHSFLASPPCSTMFKPPELQTCPSVPDVSFPLDLVSRSSCIVPQRHNSCPLSIQPHSWFPVCRDHSVLSQDLMFPEPFKSCSPSKQVTALWLVLGPSNAPYLPRMPCIFPCQVATALCADDHFFLVMLVSAYLLFRVCHRGSWFMWSKNLYDRSEAFQKGI